MKRFLHAIVLVPSARPRAALAAALIVTLLAALGASRLRVHAALDAMFPRHDAAAEALTGVMDHFSTLNELLVLVTLPRDNDPPAPDRLTAYADRLTRAVTALPGSPAAAVIYRSQPDAQEFIQRQLAPAGLFYLSDSALAAAHRRLTPAGMRQQLHNDAELLSQPGPAASAVAKATLADPLGLHEFLTPILSAAKPISTYQDSDALLSPDGRALLIRVIGRRPPDDLPYASALTAAITQAAAQADPGDLRVQLSGAYPIAAISERSIRRDALESVVTSVLLLLAVFVVVYRKPLGMFVLAFIPVAAGVFWGFGIYGATLANLSPIAAVIGGVLAGMGIDYSVLYLTRYQALRFEGRTSADAARNTIHDIGPALLAAFATSVAGFIAVGCSTIQAMRDFAILGAAGLTGTFFAVLFLLPALLVLTGWHGHRAHHAAARFNLRPLMHWATRKRASIAALAAVLCAGSLIAVATGPGVIRPDPDLSVMHPRPNPALDAEAEISRRFGVSTGSMLIRLHADTDRDLLALAHQVSRRLDTPAAKSAGIAGTYSLATWLPDPAVVAQRLATLSPADADQVAADFHSALAAENFNPAPFTGYTLFLRRLVNPTAAPDLNSLRDFPGLARDLLSADGRPDAVTVLFLKGNLETGAARDQVIAAARAALAAFPGAELTGLPVVGFDADQAVRTEMPRLFWIAVALVAVYLLIHFRSLPEMLLSLLPAAFGLIVLAAIARFADLRLNMVNIVALPLLIGIDVDYGIYLVSLPRAAAPSGALAVVVCATSMIAGYISLIWTSVPAVRSLGIIVAAGVACCLAGAIFLLCPRLDRVE